MSKLYIDTNIFINIINDEVSIHSHKNMAEYSSLLFFDAVSCKHMLLLSSWTIIELFKKIPYEDARMTFELLKKKITVYTHTKEDELNARMRSRTNIHDALHIVIAEKMRADAIITRNVSDFLQIGTMIPIKKPELV